MKKLVFSIMLFYGITANAQQLLEILKPSSSFTPSEKCLERVYDRNYGDGVHNFIYCAVKGPKGKKWLNHNLGAEYTREPTVDNPNPDFNPEAVPTSHNDWKAFGSLFQEGRKADGHELVDYYHRDNKRHSLHYTTNLDINRWYVTRKNGVTYTQQDAYNSSNQYVFRKSSNVLWAKGITSTTRNVFGDLWRGNKLNNPCPQGYRIPYNEDYMDFLVEDNDKIKILGGSYSASMVQNTDMPNLVIITAPVVNNYQVGFESNTILNAGLYRTETVDGGIMGTSSLWTVGPKAEDSELVIYGFAKFPDYISQWYSFSIDGGTWGKGYMGFLDRGFFHTPARTGQEQIYAYGIVHSLGQNGLHMSAAIRCIEE